jgi:hypothetical protein
MFGVFKKICKKRKIDLVEKQIRLPLHPLTKRGSEKEEKARG